MKAFKAYDIRGIYGKDFTREHVYKIGYFLPVLLNSKKILVGRDARTSSPEIYEALTQGITASGADVHDIGLATTPMVYFATAHFKFDASVQITASHNPKQYNGLKISRTGAAPVGYDTGLAELEQMIENEEIAENETKGEIFQLDAKTAYTHFLTTYTSDFKSLQIAVDFSNGMAALFTGFLNTGTAVFLNEKIDGTFPQHEPNPLEPANVKQLQQAVKTHQADIGIIFDGDGDRVMFTDENARFISPDLIIAFIGHYFYEKQQNDNKRVLQDIRTSKAVGEYLLQQFGCEMNTWRVGRAYAAQKLREINGLYGGELAGHYYFKDFYYSDSGMLACLIVLHVLVEFKQKGVTFSQIIDKIVRYHNSGEINFRIEDKQAAIQAVVQHFTQSEPPQQQFSFDGYRLEYNDWWFNIRPSNTEPYLRLIVEARSRPLLESRVAEIQKIVTRFK